MHQKHTRKTAFAHRFCWHERHKLPLNVTCTQTNHIAPHAFRFQFDELIHVLNDEFSWIIRQIMKVPFGYAFLAAALTFLLSFKSRLSRTGTTLSTIALVLLMKNAWETNRSYENSDLARQSCIIRLRQSGLVSTHIRSWAYTWARRINVTRTRMNIICIIDCCCACYRPFREKYSKLFV